MGEWKTTSKKVQDKKKTRKIMGESFMLELLRISKE